MRMTILFVFALTACVGQESDPKPPAPVPPPFDAAKDDALRKVAFRGVLEPERPGFGSFAEDLTFDGWAFEVYRGSDVKLDVTRTGTSRRLDTTMFLYGPLKHRKFGDSALDADDDSGWGAHSRIDRALEPGRYLAVVGTATGTGRGHYRLALDCEGCEPQPMGALRCPDEMDQWIATCVDNVAADLWVAPAIAWHECSASLWEDDLAGADLCDPSPFVARPSWCHNLGPFRDACEWQWNDKFFLDPDVRTTPLGTGAALDALEEEAERSCDGTCRVGIQVYRYDAAEEPTAQQSVAAIIRDAQLADPNWQIEGDMTPEALEARLDALQMDLIPAASDRVGSDVFHVGRARYSRRPPPFEPDTDELWVMTYPETRWLIAIEIVHL